MNTKEKNELQIFIGNLLLYVGKNEMHYGHAMVLLRDYIFNHNYPEKVMTDVIKQVTSLMLLELPENDS